MAGQDWSMDGDEFHVLVNDEGQYCLWPSAQPVPEGWTREGPIGSKEACLKYVDEHWLDMRPVSLQRAMRNGDQGVSITETQARPNVLPSPMSVATRQKQTGGN